MVHALTLSTESIKTDNVATIPLVGRDLAHKFKWFLMSKNISAKYRYSNGNTSIIEVASENEAIVLILLETFTAGYKSAKQRGN